MDCQLKDITIFYELCGEGRPVILLHGWSGNHRHIMSDLEPIFQQRTGWQRIYLDLPGHGRTPSQAWITNQDKMLEVVADFIDHVIPGQRFAIVGASTGAYLARGVVYRKAALIDGILLSVPVIVANDAKRDAPPHVTLFQDPAVLSELEPVEAEMFQIVVIQNRKVLEALRAGSPSLEEQGDAGFQAQIRDDPARYAFSFDVDALTEPLTAPALIISGRQDSIVGYRDAWKILENYPRSTFAVLDRAGHFLEVEQEGLFRALVGEWLDRVELSR
jgi:pimeloyl-ACP methyl ester carboxylesterase